MSGCQVGLGRGPGWGADLGVGGLSAVSQIGVGTWLKREIRERRPREGVCLLWAPPFLLWQIPTWR